MDQVNPSSTSGTSTSTSSGGASPPVRQGPVIPPRPASAWPTVVGVIACVFGGAGVLTYGVCGIIGTIAGGAFMGMAVNMQPAGSEGANVMEAQAEVARTYFVPMLLLQLVATALAVLLLIGGIQLLRRRAGSAKLFLIWAIGKIVYIIPSMVVQYFNGRATMEAMEESMASDSNAPAGFMGFMQGTTVIMTVLSGLWMLALPVFMLIWFNLPKIKAEVAAWNGASVART